MPRHLDGETAAAAAECREGGEGSKYFFAAVAVVTAYRLRSSAGESPMWTAVAAGLSYLQLPLTRDRWSYCYQLRILLGSLSVAVATVAAGVTVVAATFVAVLAAAPAVVPAVVPPVEGVDSLVQRIH